MTTQQTESMPAKTSQDREPNLFDDMAIILMPPLCVVKLESNNHYAIELVFRGHNQPIRLNYGPNRQARDKMFEDLKTFRPFDY